MHRQLTTRLCNITFTVALAPNGKPCLNRASSFSSRRLVLVSSCPSPKLGPRIFYHRGKKTAAADAEYFHGFLRAEIKIVPCPLKLGGYDGFFRSLRTLQRSNDPAYHVLHLRGFSLTDARAVLPSDSFGLTRSSKGLE